MDNTIFYIYANLGKDPEPDRISPYYIYADLSDLVPTYIAKRCYVAGKVPGGTVDALGLH